VSKASKTLSVEMQLLMDAEKSATTNGTSINRFTEAAWIALTNALETGQWPEDAKKLLKQVK